MKSYKEELREFIQIYEYIDEMETCLLTSSLDEEAVYRMLYDKVFSPEVNLRMQKIFPFDWCDIDASYEDDYLSWKSGALDAVDSVRHILGSIAQ